MFSLVFIVLSIILCLLLLYSKIQTGISLRVFTSDAVTRVEFLGRPDLVAPPAPPGRGAEGDPSAQKHWPALVVLVGVQGPAAVAWKSDDGD